MSLRALAVALLVVGAPVAPRATVRQPKKVLLRIRPRLGDTLHTRFDQLVQSAGPAPHVEAVTARSNAMHVLSRSIVERVDDAGVVVLTVTDSATFDAPGTDPRKLDAARRAMRGRWARLRVSPAGAMEMLEGQRGGGPDADAITRLPGTLPESPVAVGESWMREMALPWGGGTSPFSEGGHVQVVFRLDSLVAGALAYVSMHGALNRAGVAPGGSRVTNGGTMTGHLLVDLKRGWMTDSRATFVMSTTWLPGPGAKAKPMQLRVTITQSLHCND